MTTLDDELTFRFPDPHYHLLKTVRLTDALLLRVAGNCNGRRFLKVTITLSPQPERGAIMQLRQRGLDLLVDVLDAADHAERLTPDETRRLLKEVAAVICLVLAQNEEIAVQQDKASPASSECIGKGAIAATH